MKFMGFSGEVGEYSCDLLAFVVRGDEEWSGVLKKVDEALGGLLSTVADEEKFEGKADTSLVLHTHGKIAATRVALLGTSDEVTVPAFRNYAAQAVKVAQN